MNASQACLLANQSYACQLKKLDIFSENKILLFVLYLFIIVLVAAAEQLIRDGCCGPADVAIGDPGDVSVTKWRQHE